MIFSCYVLQMHDQGIKKFIKDTGYLRELNFLDNTIYTHHSPSDKQRCAFLGDFLYFASCILRRSIQADFPHHVGGPLALLFFPT